MPEGMTEVTKPKPWRMDVGVAIGSLAGALIWWSAYAPGEGLFQNLGLIVSSAAFGILFVNLRNWRKKAGPYDPEIKAQNRRGRV